LSAQTQPSSSSTTTSRGESDSNLSSPTGTLGEGSSTPPAVSQKKGADISGGAIAGIVIGAVFVITLLGFLMWWIVLRKRKGQQIPQDPHQDGRYDGQAGLEIGEKPGNNPGLADLAEDPRSQAHEVSGLAYAAPQVVELQSETALSSPRHELQSSPRLHTPHEMPGVPDPVQSQSYAVSEAQQPAPPYSDLPERAEYEYHVNPMPEPVAANEELAWLERELQETRLERERLNQIHTLNLKEQQLRDAIERRRATLGSP
jgi:hypothetical protein